MVDSREAEVDLMEKVEDLIVLCRIKANINRRMMRKIGSSGKVVVHTEEVMVLTEEEVILILEVVSVVIVLDVVKKDKSFEYRSSKSRKGKKNVVIKGDDEH